MTQKMRDLIVRGVSGAVMLVIVLGAILWSKWSLTMLLLAVACGCTWEFYNLAEKCGATPQRLLGCTLVILYFGAVSLPHFGAMQQHTAYMELVIMLIGVPLIFICELWRKEQKPLFNIAMTIVGASVSAVITTLLLTMSIDSGGYNPWILLGLLFTIWANDIFAYLVGMSIGRHKLFERISPKKSWEGFFGGVVAAIITACIIGHFQEQNIWVWAGFGLVASLSGVCGDLVESMIKREAGVKDSGSIMPGHGGWLDRFDALIMATPFIYVYLIAFSKYIY